MITTGQLIVGILVAVAGIVSLLLFAAAAWGAYRLYKVLGALADIPDKIQDFATFTKGHTAAALKIAAAADVMSKSVQAFAQQVFVPAEKSIDLLTFGTDERVDQENAVNELMRDFPQMKREDALATLAGAASMGEE